MPDAIDALVAQWRKAGFVEDPGALEARLDALEREASLTLPPDFRKLYSLANGMADYDCDDKFLSLWSLNRIAEEGGVWWHLEADAAYIHFADAMISAPNFALRLPRKGVPDIVATWYDFDLAQHQPVATSVFDFCVKHLAHKLPGPIYFD